MAYLFYDRISGVSKWCPTSVLNLSTQNLCIGQAEHSKSGEGALSFTSPLLFNFRAYRKLRFRGKVN